MFAKKIKKICKQKKASKIKKETTYNEKKNKSKI